MQHNHPIELSTNEMLDQRLDYTHNNTVVAGFVENQKTGFGVVPEIIVVWAMDWLN